MRLCRYRADGEARIALYQDDAILDLRMLAERHPDAGDGLPDGHDLVALLAPEGRGFEAARRLAEIAAQLDPAVRRDVSRALDHAELLRPIEWPRKTLLLAGNYAAHIEEGRTEQQARAREETFPYVFMKPPTALNDPGATVHLPAVSPEHIDWEVELGVVIGRRCKGVAEEEALAYVAGYTVVNDISDREFHPNPNRVERPNDRFFDWLHGKWHDGFCPMGPCVLTADEVPDPQTLHLMLRVNGETKQDANTVDMIFPVAAIVSFISSFVTLEPGDVIATGTPEGTGAASGTYLRAGDVVEAEIERIGVLRNTIDV